MFWEKVKGKLVLCLLSLPQTPLSFSFLSSFSREKVDCYYFLPFLFCSTQRVAQEQRPIVISNIKSTYRACHMQEKAIN